MFYANALKRLTTSHAAHVFLAAYTDILYQRENCAVQFSYQQINMNVSLDRASAAALRTVIKRSWRRDDAVPEGHHRPLVSTLTIGYCL